MSIDGFHSGRSYTVLDEFDSKKFFENLTMTGERRYTTNLLCASKLSGTKKSSPLLNEFSLRDSEGELGGRCPKPTPRNKTEGVMLAGVAVASSCQIILPVFGILFLIVGTVLSLAAYRGPDLGEDSDQYLERLKTTSNLRVFGPCCLAVGLVMLLAGFSLCLLSRRAKKMRLAFRCPIHGDFYPISTSHSNYLMLSKRSSLGVCGHGESEETLGLPTPQCPHSNRSSVSTGPVHPMTGGSPLPPVASSVSFSGLNTPTYPIGEITGSTQSLAVSYDVASFPHSREPSPTRHTRGSAETQAAG